MRNSLPMANSVFSSLVAGARRPGGSRRAVLHPGDGSWVADVEDAREQDVEAALAAAVHGARAMARLTACERAQILRRTASAVADRADALARGIALEAGKPVRDARIEVSRCEVTFRTAAEEASRLGGEVIPIDAAPNGAGRLGIVRRFPVGIITAITPFNFPLNLAAHKVAPALASGNAVILKPAPRTPLSAFALAEILLDCGCPPEAIAVTPGVPPVIDPLIEDPRVSMVSFTGSAQVGWELRRRAPKKKVTLELGGNAAVIIHSDADLGAAVARCTAGAFTYSGQVCIRSQRILLHEAVAERFLAAFLARGAALRMGSPLEESTDLGPMIDAAAASRAASWVAEAIEAGARRLLGGEPRGSYFPPTVLTDVPRTCRAYAEEIFAPVVTVETYSSLEEALAIADDSKYGLQAGIFTNDLAAVLRAHERLTVGALIHNDVPMFRADPMPYGGVRESGIGREGLRYAMEEMTEPRLLVLRPDPNR